MQKRRAIQLCAGLTIGLAGYVAWCSREFYLWVKMPDLSEVPEDALALVEREIETSGLRRPQEFDFETFLYRLGDPYDPHPTQIDVMVSVGDRILGVRSDKGAAVFHLKKEDGRWVVKDPTDF